MKKSILFLTILIFSGLLLLNGCKKEEDNPVEPEPQASSLGTLKANQSDAFVNTSTNVTFNLTVPANVTITDTSIALVKVASDNSVVDTVGKLFDDGNLNNGDEIAGDNVFSGILSLNENSPADYRYRAVGTIKVNDKNVGGNSNVVTITFLAQLTQQELNELKNVQNTSTTKFEEFLNGDINNIDQAMDDLVNWLNNQSAVESVTNSGNTGIEIKYKSGLYGAITITQEDANGTSLTRGGVIDGEKKRKTESIPLNQQTRGTYFDPPNKTFFKISDLDPKYIGNRNVLIYAPFEGAFAPYNEGQDVVNILNDSDFEYEITYLSNQQANLAALNNLTSYGFVILATHGSGGTWFGSGQIVDTSDHSYDVLLKSGKISIWKNMVINSNGGTDVKADLYAVRHTYISSIAGTFPNSVILNNSCESTQTNNLANAFTGKGAKTYFGYSKVVNSDFCVKKAKEIAKGLCKDSKTTGESFDPENDPHDPFAQFQMVGSDEQLFPDFLINGDFELGNQLLGWTKAGDGRVLSKLGFLNPKGGSYMGIISTGLGYTTSTGKIYQTFRVPDDATTLSVDWNFLSEEFLEWINSSYQDYFQVIIKDKDGNENMLLNKYIDDIAADFGATKEDPGDLIAVSPDIVFDKGGVYMTDWQNNTFNVTQYRGKLITLILAAGDVGDSIYDTAILLDNITIE